MPPWLWLILLFLGVCALALFGLKGDVNWWAFLSAKEFPDQFYGVIQLFVLEGRVLGPPGSSRPVPLLIAAFAAPVVTIFAFLQLVWTELSAAASVVLYRVYYRNHVVVLGMGKRGRTFVLDALKQDKRVVAIDLNPGAASQIPTRFRKFRFVQADVLNPHLIGRFGLARASVVVIFCGSGFTNISVAQHVSSELGALNNAPETWPRLICDATGSAQRDQIEADQLFEGALKPQIEFYSPEDVAARLLIATHRPADFAALFRRQKVHAIVYGDGALVEAIIRQFTALTQNAAGDRPRITLVARLAEARRTNFEALARNLAPVAEMEVVDADPVAPEFWDGAFAPFARTASQHIACLDHPQANLELALRLEAETHALADANVPIFVGPSGTRAALDEQSETVPHLFANNLLTRFGDQPNVLGWRFLIDRDQDKLARQNHENYRQQVKSETGSDSPISKPAALPWVRLPERFRYSNRSLVDHLSAKLALIDHVIGEGCGVQSFTPEQVDTLARDEHNRWWAERISTGWQYAKERDDKRRFHHEMLPWDELDDSTRDYDIELVAKIPALLSGIGKCARPVHRIGVSGHRLATISQSNRPLVAAIKTELQAIQQNHPGHAFEIWSPLAEGADRLVAELAMQMLEARLHVPLPLPLDQYCEDFEHENDGEARESLRHFQRLIAKAVAVFEVPLMERIEEPPTHRQWQYASVGALILQRCDEMIFVWDGQPAKGFGGTGHMVEWQKSGQIPDRLGWPALGRGTRAAARIVSFARDEQQ